MCSFSVPKPPKLPAPPPAPSASAILADREEVGSSSEVAVGQRARRLGAADLRTPSPRLPR